MSNGEFVRRDRVMATVVEVEFTKMGSKVKFELSGGKYAIFLVSKQVLKVGEKRPILIDVYDNGKNYVTYDRMDWDLNY